MSKAKFKVGDNVIYSNKNLSLPEKEYRIIGHALHSETTHWILEPIERSDSFPNIYELVNTSMQFVPDAVHSNGGTINRCLWALKRSKNLKSAYLQYDPSQQADSEDDI